MSLWTWMLWSVQQRCYIHWSENLNLTPITSAVKYPENNFLSVFVFLGYRVVLMHSTNTWLHTRKNTLGELWLGCLLVSVSCSGIWWMVSKQKASLRSEQQRDYEQMMDGSVSCIASLQHTALTTHHTTQKRRGKNQGFLQETTPYTHTETTELPHVDVLKYTNS